MARLGLMRPQTGETNGEWRARFSVLTCGDSMIQKAWLSDTARRSDRYLGAGEMTFGIGRSNSSTGYDHWRPPNALQQRALGGATLVSVAALCAWTLCSTLADTSPDQINLASTRGDKLVVVARRGDKLVILKPGLLAANVPGPRPASAPQIPEACCL